MNGRIMIGPITDRIYIIFTWSVITVVSILFGVFVFPFLWIHWKIIPIFFIAFLSTTVIFLILTTTTEPGIIPHKAIM